jgi:hypothetical protein
MPMSDRNVSKEEFDAFVAAYPRSLERDVARMYEPHLLTLNDFSGGKVWPDSVVAGATLYEVYPKDGTEPYRWQPNRYFIREPDDERR